MVRMQRGDNRSQIIEAAEKRARLGGYNGFSFRDLAEDVGIKSASVHYHFPTKEDLAVAITARYAERALEGLGNPTLLNSIEAFDRVAALFTHSDQVEDLMCLCGVFGAETDGLPRPLTHEVRKYFDALTAWLSSSLNGEDSKEQAELILAALEGGLILSRVSGDHQRLTNVITQLRRDLH